MTPVEAFNNIAKIVLETEYKMKPSMGLAIIQYLEVIKAALEEKINKEQGGKNVGNS